MLIIDNASFHHSDRIKQLCSNVGVKLLFLPPCSPDFNYQGILRGAEGLHKKDWRVYEEDPDQGFNAFLRCVHDVGAKKESAEGHFRNAGIKIDKV